MFEDKSKKAYRIEAQRDLLLSDWRGVENDLSYIKYDTVEVSDLYYRWNDLSVEFDPNQPDAKRVLKGIIEDAGSIMYEIEEVQGAASHLADSLSMIKENSYDVVTRLNEMLRIMEEPDPVQVGSIVAINMPVSNTEMTPTHYIVQAMVPEGFGTLGWAWIRPVTKVDEGYLIKPGSNGGGLIVAIDQDLSVVESPTEGEA